ncbi:hypothetical protein KW796_01930 [Candidatus Parcubacteria bacterium]|nr:hypothetical protein [Candidatus Parcubacteria bacterium]
MQNEKKLWFKAKKFGWGWTPTSWQGWVITAIYIIGLLHLVFEADVEHSGGGFLINFAFDFLILTIPFLIICYLKGERPHWRWDGVDKDHTQTPSTSL